MAARPSISELGPLVQKGTPVPREPVATPSLRAVTTEESPPPIEPEVAEGRGMGIQQPSEPPKRPDSDLLARYRPEPRVQRETVSVKITRPTLERLEAFIDATKAQRQTVWEDALVQLLDRVGF
ncbi:MAG: hypothetical protein M3Y22_13345 [Pseudomonadota bacterium]|nr:hypothetical protein [Pseudomonadota bacterium]